MEQQRPLPDSAFRYATHTQVNLATGTRLAGSFFKGTPSTARPFQKKDGSIGSQTACRHGFRCSFRSPPGYFSSFPPRYYPLSVRQGDSGLTPVDSRQIPQHDSTLRCAELLEHHHSVAGIFVCGTTHYGHPELPLTPHTAIRVRQTLHVNDPTTPTPQPPGITHTGLRHHPPLATTHGITPIVFLFLWVAEDVSLPHVPHTPISFRRG